MISKITFEDALERTNEKDKYLLLGNGFSISIHPTFNYESLFEVATGKNEELIPHTILSEESIQLFNDLDTHDFEKVLAFLKISKKVLQHYNTTSIIYKKIDDDIKRIKQSLISSLTTIHPLHPGKINDETYNLIGKFLGQFKKIFTLNYDMLLYWIIMHNIKNLNNKNNIPHDDGFRKNNYRSYCDAQQIFFLHGALHLFNGNNGIEKLVQETNLIISNPILNQVKRHIELESYPIIVLEGKYQDKIITINENSYLGWGLHKFKKLDGALFIFGVSLNPYSDGHIIEAIKHSKIKELYISVHNESSCKTKLEELESKDRHVFTYNSSEVTSWANTGQPNGIE